MRYKKLTIKGVYSPAREATIKAFRMLAENTYYLERLHADEFPLEDAEHAILALGRERDADRNPICVSLHPEAANSAGKAPSVSGR